LFADTLPPNSFFDAIIDVQATLSANVAVLVGKQMNTDLFDRWRAAVERHATPDGRLPFGAYLIQHGLFACAEKEVVMVEDDDEVTQRLYQEGKLAYTISRNFFLKDQGSWLCEGAISDCLQWLQKEYEGFQCTAYVIACPFQLEKVCRMFERRVARGRFEGVGTVANVYGAHCSVRGPTESDPTNIY
jgi:hypothetical protein